MLSKTKALWRIRSLISQKQADAIYNSFIISYLHYCPLVWMFTSKQAHNLINWRQCIALCSRFNIYSGKLSELLQQSNSIPIHTKNLRLMVVEVYKSLNFIGPEIMWGTFDTKSVPYNLRQGHTLKSVCPLNARTLNTFDFCASLAWNKLPGNLKTTTYMP